jgi:hypothetical protein
MRYTIEALSIYEADGDLRMV